MTVWSHAARPLAAIASATAVLAVAGPGVLGLSPSIQPLPPEPTAPLYIAAAMQTTHVPGRRAAPAEDPGGGNEGPVGPGGKNGDGGNGDAVNDSNGGQEHNGGHRSGFGRSTRVDE